MPYRVTSIQDEYRYTAIVPRRLLAYTIINYLARLDLTQLDFERILFESHLNPVMIVNEAKFDSLLESHPGLDLIYDTILLKDNRRIFFHTNWTVPENNWQLMAEQLNRYQITVETIPTPDTGPVVKTKQKLTPEEIKSAEANN